MGFQVHEHDRCLMFLRRRCHRALLQQPSGDRISGPIDECLFGFLTRDFDDRTIRMDPEAGVRAWLASSYLIANLMRPLIESEPSTFSIWSEDWHDDKRLSFKGVPSEMPIGLLENLDWLGRFEAA